MDKNRGVVEICARVFEPNINCPIDFAFNLIFDTIDGSAGSYNIMYISILYNAILTDRE